MLKPSGSCTNFIEKIKQGGSVKEKTALSFYESNFHIYWKMRRKWTALSHEEVRDAYSDAIVALILKIEQNKFQESGRDSCAAFIYQVCSHKCSDTWRSRKHKLRIERELEEEDRILESPATLYDRELIDICFQKLSENCRQVLKDWMSGYSMKEISGRNGLANENVAAVTRKRCMTRLIEYLKKQGMEGLAKG